MIQSEIDNDQFICSVFINLQKAIDTVDHEIHQSKMNHYGIRGIPYEWWKSYLTNRQKFTPVNNKESDFFNIEFGILQG